MSREKTKMAVVHHVQQKNKKEIHIQPSSPIGDEVSKVLTQYLMAQQKILREQKPKWHKRAAINVVTEAYSTYLTDTVTTKLSIQPLTSHRSDKAKVILMQYLLLQKNILSKFPISQKKYTNQEKSAMDVVTKAYGIYLQDTLVNEINAKILLGLDQKDKPKI